MRDAVPAPGSSRAARVAASVALLMLRLALAGVFLFAAYTKLLTPMGPLNFSEAVQSFKFFGEHDDGLVMLTTYAVPWAELIAGVCLVLGFWTRAAALLLGLLLTLFIALVASAIFRDMHIHCGCFGNFNWPCPETVSWCKIGANSALLLAAMVLHSYGGGAIALDGCGTRTKPE